MIYYLATDRFSFTVKWLLEDLSELRGLLRCLTYEELFYERRGPLGHCIFTDIDRLTRPERETARNFADALRAAEPRARIFNDPALALDRVALLAALHRAGINDFTAERLDVCERPSRYPVFLRTEDGHSGPETGLINDDAAFDAALGDLRARGLPLRGRIAVGFGAKPGADGRFRRHSAYKIGGRVFADELFISREWAVKDKVAEWGGEEAVEELEFVRANPHREALERAFAAGHIDFGRTDYGVVDGRIQVFEINTNPTFALRFTTEARAEMRGLVRRMIADAFQALDTPLGMGGRVAFSIAGQSAHRFHRPRGWRMLKSVARRIGDGSMRIRVRGQKRRG